MFTTLTGTDPISGGQLCLLDPVTPRDIPNLPAGFDDQDNYVFASYVHLLDQPIFFADQMPAEDDTSYVDLNTVPWGDVTFDAEGLDIPGQFYSRVPHIPLGNNGLPIGSSGITIGRGLDIGSYDSSSQAHLDYLQDVFTRAGLEPAEITALLGGVGLQGRAALNYLNSSNALQNLELTREQQYLIYLQVYDQHANGNPSLPGRTSGADSLYTRFIQGTGVNWDALDDAIRDVLVDIQYRGDFTQLSSGNSRPGYAQFTQAFRDAASSNNVSDMCQVMGDQAWLDAWGVPPDRFIRRVAALGGTVTVDNAGNATGLNCP